MIVTANNIIKPALHLLTWCILFISPFLIADKGVTDNSRILIHFWVPLIEGAIIFYINYFFLIEQILFLKRQYVLFVVLNIFLIVFFRLDMQLLNLITVHDTVKPLHDHNLVNGHEGKHRFEAFALLKSILSLTIPAIFALGIKSTELWRKFEWQRKEVENKHLQSELKNLKYQLQPHFFFNSLNNIYALIGISPTTAQKAVYNLSKLMRYFLYETNHDKVDLSVELNFLKKYIQLMELRQADHIVTNYKLQEISPKLYGIAPLLLVSIIENAFKHGVSATENSKIFFDLSVTHNRLLFKSFNTNYPKDYTDESGSGLGLDNLKKQLELIYPGKHGLETQIENDMFGLELWIDLDKLI
ncbi:MAG: histidine kinase [Chitinophagaceae bacterium]|nr:histidine kinase [Chitinophagaceae bacterium]